MKFEIGVASLQGSRKRQEDRSSIVEKGGAVLAAVFDGLGGVPNGAEAAQAAAIVFDACPFDAALIPLLTRLVADSHWAVKRTGGMTCLAAALFLPDGTLALANVGDPAIVRVRLGHRELPYAVLTDRDRATRHTVLHSLGSSNWQGRIQVVKPARVGDRYLIATDGVVDALPSFVVEDVCRAFLADPQRVASILAKAAADQPNSDNATVIVVDVRA